MDWVGNAEAFLFGRRTYESFARDWPQADADDPFAPIMNGLPKYVASRSPLAADWDPTTVLSGDVLAEVAALKRQPGGELQIHGSTTLARSLFGAGLIDELRLVVAPVVVGAADASSRPMARPAGCGSSAARRRRAASCSRPTSTAALHSTGPTERSA